MRVRGRTPGLPATLRRKIPRSLLWSSWRRVTAGARPLPSPAKSLPPSRNRAAHNLPQPEQGDASEALVRAADGIAVHFADTQRALRQRPCCPAVAKRLSPHVARAVVVFASAARAAPPRRCRSGASASLCRLPAVAAERYFAARLRLLAADRRQALRQRRPPAQRRLRTQRSRPAAHSC